MDSIGALPLMVGGLSKLILASAFLAWLTTFGARALALKLGVVAKRSSRRRHDKDTALLGGLTYYIVLALTAGGLIFFRGQGGLPDIEPRTVGCFLVAITLLFSVGVLDDLFELKAPPKFAIQILAAFIVVAFEPTLPPIFQHLNWPSWLVIPIAMFCIVGMTNAFNMIDGLDGLCAGLGAIAAMGLAAVGLATLGQPTDVTYYLLALAGCSAGFLFHNFNPATIFLGDSGSLLIGFVVATAAMRLDVHSSYFLVDLSIPLLALGLPIMDVTFSIMRRRRLMRSIFQGDRSHIHHRLTQVGIGHRSVVLVLWACAAYLGAASYFIVRVQPTTAIYIYASVLPTIAFWVIALYFIEYRLSYQAAKYGHLFMKHEDLQLRDTNRLARYLRTQVRNHHNSAKPFTLIVIDCADFIKELAHERPYRMVAFYMNVYGILKARLRETDLIARVADHRFVAILAGAGEEDGSDLAVISYLGSQIKSLQESYQVFQSHPHRPEGFRVFRYPREAQKIWQILETNPITPGTSESHIETVAPMRKAG